MFGYLPSQNKGFDLIDLVPDGIGTICLRRVLAETATARKQSFGLLHYPPVRGNFVPKFKNLDTKLWTKGVDVSAVSGLRAPMRIQVLAWNLH